MPAEPEVSAPARDLALRLRAAIAAAVVVREEMLDLALICLLAQGHLLLEDVPGVGKTLLARSLAAAVGGAFRRIQFTPDLLPADITGGSVYDPRTAQFSFRRGPIFANVILADEINRGTPRAQSALLEAMGEGSVSVDGETHPLAPPFFVVATQNPVEQHGTFPLPEAELDRFTMLLRVGRPDAAHSALILERHVHSSPASRTVAEVVSLGGLRTAQEQVLRVTVSAAAREYIAAVVLATRSHPAVGLPASPRASVALMRSAQARALLQGRDHVLPDDVKALAIPVLGHRLAVAATRPDEVVADIVDATPIPRLP